MTSTFFFRRGAMPQQLAIFAREQKQFDRRPRQGVAKEPRPVKTSATQSSRNVPNHSGG